MGRVILSFPSTLPHSTRLAAKGPRAQRRLLLVALIFWFLLLTAVAIILGVWFLGYKGAHLEAREPRGSFHAQAQFIDGETIDLSRLPYCSQSGGGSGVDCVIGAGSDVVYPDASGDSLFVVTRVRRTEQIRSCAPNATQCLLPPYESLSEEVTYWASPETLQLRVAHAVLLDDRQYSELDLTGDLVDERGNVLQRFAKEFNDIRLGTLLAAAGITLDAPSDWMQNNTYRFDGLILNVVVQYTNWRHFTAPTHLPAFRYRVYHVPRTEYRLVTPEPSATNDTHRTLNNRHGVLLQFSASGLYYSYDGFSMLLVLVSTLYLLSYLIGMWKVLLASLFTLPPTTHFVD